jgi:hypothetical protein
MNLISNTLDSVKLQIEISNLLNKVLYINNSFFDDYYIRILYF